MPCTSLWLVSTANPLEMAKEGHVIWYLDFSCSRIGLQLTSPWILKTWLNSWRVVLEFFYMIQKFITLTTEREAIIFKEYQLSKILLSDPLLNHTRFKTNMKEDFYCNNTSHMEFAIRGPFFFFENILNKIHLFVNQDVQLFRICLIYTYIIINLACILITN